MHHIAPLYLGLLALSMCMCSMTSLHRFGDLGSPPHVILVPFPCLFDCLACIDTKTWSIATQASKALKRHARQSNKHGNGTEITCGGTPNHQFDAKMSCYTCTYSRLTSPNTKELYQACQNRPKHLWTDLKHGRIST